MSVWANGLPPYPQISFSARFCPKVQLWRRLYREGYYPKVSMNPSFWLYFWYILTTYWLQFGYILPTCWLHSVTFWLHFGHILDTFCLHVNSEPIIRGLKSDLFEVWNPFHICRIQLQKKKSGVKKCLEILPLRGGGRRLMANTILNFHFDYWHTSLRKVTGIDSSYSDIK